MILKLQWPLASSHPLPEADVLAYTEGRKLQWFLPQSDELKALFAGRPKVYVEADLVAGKLEIRRRVAQQPW